MTDLVVGKGRLYFEPFLPNTKTLSGEGWGYFGNTPELTLSKEVEILEHFSSEGGVNVMDNSLETSETTAGAFITDHISADNLKLWHRGTKNNIAQLAGNDVSETWANVKKGNYFQLGEVEGQPMGVRKVTEVNGVKGNATATGDITFSTAVPVDGNSVTINGVELTFVAAAANQNEVSIGGTIAATATNLANAINAHSTLSNVVIADDNAAVTELTAVASGESGNAITLAKDAATPANITVSGATLTGGTNTAVAGNENFTFNPSTGMVYIKPDAPDIAEGDSVTFTYSNDAANLTVVISGSTSIEGRMKFVADNPKGENKDYYWPYVRISADGDYEIISEEWAQLGFSYTVLKLNDETPREYVSNRG